MSEPGALRRELKRGTYALALGTLAFVLGSLFASAFARGAERAIIALADAPAWRALLGVCYFAGMVALAAAALAFVLGLVAEVPASVGAGVALWAALLDAAFRWAMVDVELPLLALAGLALVSAACSALSLRAGLRLARRRSQRAATG